MADRTMFQGKCLVNSEGFRFMEDWYDRFPSVVRERLRNSPYNLCAACVDDLSYRLTGGGPRLEEHRIQAIEQMEAAIKAEENGELNGTAENKN